MPSTTSPAPGASGAVARRFASDLVTDGVERPITVDQTNISVVVDDAVIVKWFQPPVPHPHLGVEMLEHLRDVAFRDVPGFFGAEVDDGVVTAIAGEYIVGGLDGWDWLIDEMTATIGGTVEPVDLVRSVGELGALTARLHIALATPSAQFQSPVAPVALDAEQARARHLVADAFECAEGEAATVLQAHEPAISAVIDRWPSGGETPAMRLHGDLHAGQVLHVGDRLLVVDFDGNPLLDPGERHTARAPAVDIASLLQSIDHAARVVQQRHPQHTDLLDVLIAESVAATLSEYRRGVAAARMEYLFDERLLWPLRVTQELHEFVYASQHLPGWAYVPTATLRSMLGKC